MKAQLHIFSLIGLILVGSVASAEVHTQKPATRIDFNRMINENNNTKTELSKELAGEVARKSGHEIERAEVIDFVDVEVRVGAEEAPMMVDRRVNSVTN